MCNGASPLVLDNSRHNTALHWAASACRSECVQRLLGSAATFQMQSGEVVRIADIPCFDEDNSTLVKFVDRHNGWGLTALHIAVFKGSTSTGGWMQRLTYGLFACKERVWCFEHTLSQYSQAATMRTYNNRTSCKRLQAC